MKRRKKLSNSEVAAFCGQLSLLLPAGITPSESIRLMAEDTATKEGKALLHSIEKSLLEGRSLHESVKAEEVFPAYAVSMILLGEESGNLDIIAKKLAGYYEQQRIISESVKNAVSYPLVMVFIMLIILAILLSRILPIFNQVFQLLGSELTGVSRQLMQTGVAAQYASGSFIAFLALSCATGFIMYKNPRGNAWLKTRLHTWRPTRGFYLGIAYSRFAGALSMVMAGGIDIYRGLSLAGLLIDNKLMTEKINVCKESLLRGDDLHDAIKKAGIFQAQHQRMLQAGCFSGNLDAVFGKISMHYEDSVLNRIQKILGTVEPTLVIIFSLIVGVVLLSVIMPLIGIMSSIGA